AGIVGAIRMAPAGPRTDRPAFCDQRPRYAVDAWQGPDPRGPPLRDPGREEPPKCTRTIRDTGRAISRANQSSRGPENFLQYSIEIEISGDRQRRLVQGRQPACALR